MKNGSKSITIANAKSKELLTLNNNQLEYELYTQIRKKFFSALSWNALESLLYHITFLTHQYYLYQACTPELYGQVGICFSVAYFLMYIFIGGIDIALIPFVKNFTSSRSEERICLKNYIIPHCIYMTTLAFWAGIVTYFFYPIFYNGIATISTKFHSTILAFLPSVLPEFI